MSVLAANLFSAKLGAINAKIETNEQTDATPALGTDDIPCMQMPSFNMNVEHGTIRLESPNGGESPAPVIGYDGSFELEVPLYGKGKSGTPLVLPKWMSVLLQTCGDVDNSGGSGATCVWVPTPHTTKRLTNASGSPSDVGSSLSLYGYWGIQGRPDSGKTVLGKVVGARIGQIVLNFPNRGIATARIGGSGRLVEPADVTLSGGGTDLSSFANDGLVADFIRGAGLTTLLGLTSDAGNAQETDTDGLTITVDFGLEQVRGDAAADGFSHAAFGDLTVTASLSPVCVQQSVFDYVSHIFDPVRFDSGSYDPAFLETSEVKPDGRTAASGFGVKAKLPSCQWTGQYDRGGNTLRNSLQVKATRSGGYTGNLLELTLQ